MRPSVGEALAFDTLEGDAVTLGRVLRRELGWGILSSRTVTGWILNMIEPLLIVGIVIMGTVFYMRAKWRRQARNAARLAARNAMQHSTGLELLARRYARGEIDREEYLQKRSDILGYQVVAPRPSVVARG